MSEQKIDEAIGLLREIRDNQRAQLEASKQYFERAKQIQDRSEELQAKSSAIMDRGRAMLAIIIPVVIALIVYVSWLLFRR